MEEQFYRSLEDKVVAQLTTSDPRIVLWGFNPVSVRLASRISELGFRHTIQAIIDDASAGRKFHDFVVEQPGKIKELAFDVVVICADAEKEAYLSAYSKQDRGSAKIIIAGREHYEFNDPSFDAIKASCPVKSKAGGYPYMLTHLFQSLQHIANRRINGAVAEFGCFQCGTTVFLARTLLSLGVNVPIYAFDTFAGYPAPKSALDLFFSKKCEFRDFDFVQRYCSPYNIKLIKGNIEETIQQLREVPLALSFFDTDNYSPTKAALELCLMNTVPGGILAFDHYYSPDWEETIGERIAAKEVFANHSLFHLQGTGIFMKYG